MPSEWSTTYQAKYHFIASCLRTYGTGAILGRRPLDAESDDVDFISELLTIWKRRCASTRPGCSRPASQTGHRCPRYLGAVSPPDSPPSPRSKGRSTSPARVGPNRSSPSTARPTGCFLTRARTQRDDDREALRLARRDTPRYAGTPRDRRIHEAVGAAQRVQPETGPGSHRLDVQRRTWTGCKAATVLYIIDGGGHGWPGKPVASMEEQFGHDTTSVNALGLLCLLL